MAIFLEINPLSKVVAVSEILIPIATTFAIGWVIGWWITNEKISELQREVALLVNKLNDCRRINKSFGSQAAFERPNQGRQDNLKLVEGIGPKVEILLNSNGILTFKDLAEVELTELLEILTKAGGGFQMYDPSTWPMQSSLARDGKWEELNALQLRLDGGWTI